MPSKSGYRIRKVDGTNPRIAETLRDLHDQTFGDHAPQIEPETSGHWWIAYHGNEPIGFAGIRRTTTDPKAAYLERSGVLPWHRGRGLQVRLIRARERFAMTMGWDMTFSDTTNNCPSANSLIKAGYKLFDPKEPWAFPHSLYWFKELHGADS